MRIAYVTETYPPELNGVALTVERTVQHLRERGHTVTLIRPRQVGEATHDTPEEWRTGGCRLPMYPDVRFGFARIGSLKKRIAAAGCELVHLATPGPLAWAAMAAGRSLGLATSTDFRTNFHSYSRYYGLGMFEPLLLAGLRRFHNLSDRSFVPTRAMRRELAGEGFERLEVVGRGVDTARFDPRHRSSALRARWDAVDDAPVLLSVGRVAAEKNVELALRAFASLRRRCPGARMVVVGDGPIRGRLEAAYPGVHFAGMQRGEALAAYYASADLFLFPSLSDTFGNVTMEALASGLPVAAFDTAAAAEHVRDHASGRLVLPGHERGFIDAVGELAVDWSDPCRRIALREEAVAAARRAQWSEVLARFELALQDTIDAAQTPAARHAAVA